MADSEGIEIGPPWQLRAECRILKSEKRSQIWPLIFPETLKTNLPLALVLIVWTGGASRTGLQQAPPAAAATLTKDPSSQEINDAFVQQISKQIAGHEQEPAGQVFKNIQVLKKTPAARLLLIMNLGYSKGLGVTCEHCHVKEDFSKDDKRPKRCARDMQLMHGDINQQLVKMQNLAPNLNGHFINCSTCHRGQIDPMAQAN